MRQKLGVILNGEHDRTVFDFLSSLQCRFIAFVEFNADVVTRNHFYRVRLVKLYLDHASFVYIFKTDRVTKMTKL